MKKVRQYLIYIFILLVGFLGTANNVFAADKLKDDVENIRIVPATENPSLVETYIKIQKGEAAHIDAGGDLSFWNNYEKSTKKLQKAEDLGGQIQGGFIDFNTIVQYAAYLIRLISNIAIAIAALFVAKGGYDYVMQTWGGKEKTMSYLKNIVIGVFIMSFAYGIIKILTFTFLE